MHTQIFFFPRVFCPFLFMPDDTSSSIQFPPPPGRAGCGGGEGRSPLPSAMILCSQTGQTRSGVMAEPPVGGYGIWGPRAWAETAPWHPMMVTVSASVTPCFCTLGQARRHGTCWLPRNEGMWGCRVTGMLPRWATGFVLQVFSFSHFSLSFHLQGDKGSRGEKVRTART